MQQRDPDGAVLFDLGHEDHGAIVALAARDEALLLHRDEVLRAAQSRVGAGARTDLQCYALLLVHVDRRVAGFDIAFDAIARRAEHGVHCGIQRRERAQVAVADAIARCARRQRLAHEARSQQCFVAARDADGDGLRLVLDGIDRAREFVDRRRQIFGQRVDDCAGRAGTAKLDGERVERHQRQRVVAQRSESRRGLCFERAVVAAHQQVLAELDPMRQQPRMQAAQRILAQLSARRDFFDRAARLAQRQSERIDRERCAIAKQVACHRRQHERERGMRCRNVDHAGSGGKARLAARCDDEGLRLVRAIDRDFLCDVIGGRASEARGADEDHRLRREVDVLLVLRRVACDRLVAQLAELDAHLGGRDLVVPVADERPVAALRRMRLGERFDRWILREHFAHRIRQRE